MRSERRRSNAEWLADLRNEETQADALAELREYLLRAVYLYMDRFHQDLPDLDQRELGHLAEDFAQEALLQIQAELDTFRGESRFTTWAFRFVINIANQELRLSRWRTLSLDELVGKSETSRLAFFSDQESPDPETVAARNQIVELIREILDKELTERQRLAFIGVYFQGMSMAQVALRLETTTNNVYKLIHDARKKLKDGLREHHYTEGDILAIFGAR